MKQEILLVQHPKMAKFFLYSASSHYCSWSVEIRLIVFSFARIRVPYSTGGNASLFSLFYSKLEYPRYFPRDCTRIQFLNVHGICYPINEIKDYSRKVHYALNKKESDNKYRFDICITGNFSLSIDA